ncbi:MAG TPA: BrnT family toxin [Sulfurovum sp.]|nr:BrnT family toxin [Sulfurovum sp.]
MNIECLNIENIVGFEWDDGNIYKNEKKHGLKWQLIEEVFFNAPLLLLEDVKHSKNECRCFALGQTDDGIELFIVFTKRVDKIRVISARHMSKKERRVYEQNKKDS